MLHHDYPSVNFLNWETFICSKMTSSFVSILILGDICVCSLFFFHFETLLISSESMERMRGKKGLGKKWKNIVNVLALEFLIWSNILKRLFSGQNGHFIWLLSRLSLLLSSLLFVWLVEIIFSPFAIRPSGSYLHSSLRSALFMATLNETLLVRFHSTIKHFKCSPQSLCLSTRVNDRMFAIKIRRWLCLIFFLIFSVLLLWCLCSRVDGRMEIKD